MTNKFTLILILHNRHKNLDRLLEYYKNCSFPIIIADSSKEKHRFQQIKHNWQHVYKPGYSFTQKIESALQHVSTPYVAMCADDDFLIPDTLQECVSFLTTNPDYHIAQGYSIRYAKESIEKKEVHYSLIYRTSKSIEDDSAAERIQQMFSPYRSVLYAVFKTETLQYAFAGAGNNIKNLFLNEYITAFIPIATGKYKELPLLYQVREYALDSDDKTAIDLDTLANSQNEREQQEFITFKNFVFDKIQPFAQLSREGFEDVVSKFSKQLSANRVQFISFKKRVGLLINKLPVIGNWIIEKNRKRETKQDLETVITTENDKQNVAAITSLLLQHK